MDSSTKENFRSLATNNSQKFSGELFFKTHETDSWISVNSTKSFEDFSRCLVCVFVLYRGKEFAYWLNEGRFYLRDSKEVLPGVNEEFIIRNIDLLKKYSQSEYTYTVELKDFFNLTWSKT